MVFPSWETVTETEPQLVTEAVPACLARTTGPGLDRAPPWLLSAQEPWATGMGPPSPVPISQLGRLAADVTRPRSHSAKATAKLALS